MTPVKVGQSEVPDDQANQGAGTCCRWVYSNPEATGVAQSAGAQPALLYSHMGMLAVLPNGTLAAAWQVRTLLGSARCLAHFQ